MLRRLIRHPRTQALLAALLTGYLRFTFATTRWTMLNPELLRPTMVGPDGKPRGVVLGFWHERLAMMPMFWVQAKQRGRAMGLPVEGREMHVLISGHRDGQLISSIIARLDLHTVVGSTSAGARAGAIGLLRKLRQGHHIAITPDGPRGPRRRAAIGIAELAAISGSPVLASAARTTRCLVLNSWDRMVLPLPFARGVVALSPLVEVPRDGGAAALPAIEAALNAACDAADAWVAAQG